MIVHDHSNTIALHSLHRTILHILFARFLSFNTSIDIFSFAETIMPVNEDASMTSTVT